METSISKFIKTAGAHPQKFCPEDACYVNYVRLQRCWDEELTSKGPDEVSLTWVLMRTFQTRIIVSVVLLLCSTMLQLIGPSILLRMMVKHLEQPNAPVSQSVYLLVSMVLLRLCSVYFMSSSLGVTALFSGIRASGALQMLVYKKLFRLSVASDEILGKVVNICINDMERLLEAFRVGMFIISALGVTAYAFVVNLVFVGPWSLLGFIVIVASFFILGGIGGAVSVKRLASVTVTDRRVSLMAEVLAAIRLIKMYAWEDSFQQKVHDIRTEERDIIEQATFLQTISSILTPAFPILATIVSILGYVWSGNSLNAADAFTMFSVFNALQMAVGTLPFGIRMMTEAHVALRRIQRMLLMKDSDPCAPSVSAEDAVELTNVTLAWDKPVARLGRSERKRELKRLTSQHSLKSPERLITASPSDQQLRKTLRPRPLLPGVGSSWFRRRPISGNTASVSEVATTRLVVALHGVTLAIPRGKLLGVAGAIGSGKSSLLIGITGQLSVVGGSVRRAGSLALVPQTAWIYSGTVRDNILMGSPYEPDRFRRTLHACALLPDLQNMQHGELTEIGDRGVTLSGGQKHRVNLARAVYADSDIYLLDDPLSAVDTGVGQHILQHCIQGILKHKTVILVSHGVQYLSQCDEVLYMCSGHITERGTHDQLVAEGGSYSTLVGLHTAEASCADGRTRAVTNNGDHTAPTSDKSERTGNLIAEESYQSTSSFGREMLLYFKYCGMMSMLLVSVLTVLYGCCRTGSAVYLQYWIDSGDGRKIERLRNVTDFNATYSVGELNGLINDNPNVHLYMLGFAMSAALLLAIGAVKVPRSAAFLRSFSSVPVSTFNTALLGALLIVAVVALGRHIAAFLRSFSSWLLSTRVIKGSTRVHDDIVASLMRCKISFFDSTPVGRILNRVSRDMDCLDSRMPDLFEFISQRMSIIVTQMLVPMLVYPLYGLVAAALLLIYWCLWYFLVAGMRATKQLENVVRSPVIQHISSTVAGLSVIRAYNRQHVFVSRFETLLDRHSSALLTFRLTNAWFCLRGDELGVLLLGSVSAFLLLGAGAATPAQAGMVLALVYDVVCVMAFMVAIAAELAATATCIDRCAAYCQGLDYETAAVVTSSSSDPAVVTPPVGWPQRGHVTLEGVSLRYRPDLPRTLHDVTLSLPAGYRVGVVGRTGAGKSTLIATLLRLTDLEAGRVVIDGIDIATLSLKDLRSRIALIPQDPVLFTGTIRNNLDPFGEYSDSTIWKVLERSGLKGRVSRTADGLETRVTGGGDSLSAGERQLVCLARALLRNSRLLLLDEATASVDVQTDRQVQRTLRRDFSAATVVTVAHRLNTVLHHDLVVVMEAGRVREVGSPAELANASESVFCGMLRQAGISGIPARAEDEEDGADETDCVRGGGRSSPICVNRRVTFQLAAATASCATVVLEDHTVAGRGTSSAAEDGHDRQKIQSVHEALDNTGIQRRPAALEASLNIEPVSLVAECSQERQETTDTRTDRVDLSDQDETVKEDSLAGAEKVKLEEMGSTKGEDILLVVPRQQLRDTDMDSSQVTKL